MADEIPSIISHISIPVTDAARALAFYDKVMPTIGAKRVYEVSDEIVAYGKQFPEFWVHKPVDGQLGNTGNGWHVGFLAASKAQVNAFHKAALEAGGTNDGAPGPRPHYGPGYYGGFVRDLDGNKIEAMMFDASAGH